MKPPCCPAASPPLERRNRSKENGDAVLTKHQALSSVPCFGWDEDGLSFSSSAGKSSRASGALRRTPILPSYFCLTVGWGRKEEVGAVAAGGRVPPPKPNQPHTRCPKPCQSIPPCRAGGDLLPGLHRGVCSLPAAPGKGTLLETRLFCPTFNLSQHCQGPAQSPQWANKAGSGENWFLWELSVAPGCGEGGELAPLRLWVGLRNFCVGARSWGSEASSLAEDASAVLAVAQVRAVWFFLSSLQILLCRLQ